jgi:hypothetical protein
MVAMMAMMVMMVRIFSGRVPFLMQWPYRGESAYGFLVIPNQQLIPFFDQTK